MNKKIPSSVFFLLLANILPLLGVLFYNWNLINILFVYWAESGVIGFFAIFKILLAKFEDDGPIIVLIIFGRILICAFFIIHFGAFMAGHGALLYFIALEFLKMKVQPLVLWRTTWITLASLFLSHGYSFVTNYLIKGERNLEKGKDPIFEPYKRVLVMHFTLALGMGPVIFLGQPAYLLVPFIILKTILDLRAHLRERKKNNKATKGPLRLVKRLMAYGF